MTGTKALRQEAGSVMRRYLVAQRDGETTHYTRGFATGIVTAAQMAGVLSLAEKEAAIFAIEGSAIPRHLDHWWDYVTD